MVINKSAPSSTIRFVYTGALSTSLMRGGAVFVGVISVGFRNTRIWEHGRFVTEGAECEAAQRNSAGI